MEPVIQGGAETQVPGSARLLVVSRGDRVGVRRKTRLPTSGHSLEPDSLDGGLRREYNIPGKRHGGKPAEAWESDSERGIRNKGGTVRGQVGLNDGGPKKVTEREGSEG